MCKCVWDVGVVGGWGVRTMPGSFSVMACHVPLLAATVCQEDKIPPNFIHKKGTCSVFGRQVVVAHVGPDGFLREAEEMFTKSPTKKHSKL